MKIVFFTNADKDPLFSATREAMDILRDSGAQCLAYENDAGVFEGAYAALSLGGDGTFLRCAKLTLPYQTPILGVHLGHTGFLSRIHPENLSRLRGIAGFRTVPRSVLEVRLPGKDAEYAINDAVFSRGGIAQTVSLDIAVDGLTIGSFMGDGVIISTAAGSTGYSFSAGGPVTDPELPVMLVTPVCAHASRGHSFVLSPGRIVTVTPSHTERRNVYCSIDGDDPALLEGPAVVRISEQVLRCLEPPDMDFFDTVRIHRL